MKISVLQRGRPTCGLEGRAENKWKWFSEVDLVSWVPGGLRWKGICHFFLSSRFTFGFCHPQGLAGRKGRGDLEMVLMRGHVNPSTSYCTFHRGSDSSQRMDFVSGPLGSHPHSVPDKHVLFSAVGV